MKVNDEIIKYLSGNMEPPEKERFEEQISKSLDLKSELDEYRSRLNHLKNISEVEADSSYFNNLLPKVRERMEKERKPSYSISKKIAFSFPVILLLAFIIYKQFLYIGYTGVDTAKDLKTVIAQMNDSSKVELLTKVMEKSSITDTTISPNSDQLLAEEISREIFKNTTVSNSDEVIPLDTYDLINNMSEEEADLVYKNLINKKIM